MKARSPVACIGAATCIPSSLSIALVSAILAFQLTAQTPQGGPSISIDLQIASYTPNGCGTNWSHEVTGARGPTQCPAFCYRITITNTGSDDLTNVVVTSDNLDLNVCIFSTSLPRGATTLCQLSPVERCFAMLSSVQVTAQSASSGASVVATRVAVAGVTTISFACSLRLFSTNDQDLLYEDLADIRDGPVPVEYSVKLWNSNDFPLLVYLSDPLLEKLGCPNLPLVVGLSPQQSNTFLLCSQDRVCYSTALINTLTATAEVDSAATNVSRFDREGGLIRARNSCGGVVICVCTCPCVAVAPGPPQSSAFAASSGEIILKLARGLPCSTGTNGSPGTFAVNSDCGNFVTGSQWFKLSLEPDYDGLVTVTTEGSSYDTFMAVWVDTGTNRHVVACENDISYINPVKRQSRLTFRAQHPDRWAYKLILGAERNSSGTNLLTYFYAPEIESYKWNSSGLLSVTSKVPAGVSYELQAATSLGGTWTTVSPRTKATNFTTEFPYVQLTETNTTRFRQRFYRVGGPYFE